jgi:hypothetical protein
MTMAPMHCEERIAWYSNITFKELETILTHSKRFVHTDRVVAVVIRSIQVLQHRHCPVNMNLHTR